MRFASLLALYAAAAYEPRHACIVHSALLLTLSLGHEPHAADGPASRSKVTLHGRVSAAAACALALLLRCSPCHDAALQGAFNIYITALTVLQRTGCRAALARQLLLHFAPTTSHGPGALHCHRLPALLHC